MQDVKRLVLAAGVVGAVVLTGCGKQSDGDDGHDHATHGHSGEEHGDHAHAEDGHEHADDAHGDQDEHSEVALGTVTIGGMEVKAFQAHGEAAPGKELHLVVEFPEEKGGASTVRAWIGTDDRLASVVGKGEYMASRGAYGVHAVAPDPLPEGAAWWIEIEGADGSKQTGTVALR